MAAISGFLERASKSHSRPSPTLQLDRAGNGLWQRRSPGWPEIVGRIKVREDGTVALERQGDWASRWQYAFMNDMKGDAPPRYITVIYLYRMQEEGMPVACVGNWKRQTMRVHPVTLDEY